MNILGLWLAVLLNYLRYSELSMGGEGLGLSASTVHCLPATQFSAPWCSMPSFPTFCSWWASSMGGAWCSLFLSLQRTMTIMSRVTVFTMRQAHIAVVSRVISNRLSFTVTKETDARNSHVPSLVTCTT